MDERERFTSLWTAAQPIVGSYITALVPDFHESQDLLQQVALVLLRKFPEYDQQRPFVAWALGVAKFEILSARRRHARGIVTADSELLERLTATYTDLAPELSQRNSALQECLRSIEGRAAQMIHLRYVESMKPRQIAARLGLAPTVVRMALSRTRSFLRDCIERKLKIEGLAR